MSSSGLHDTGGPRVALVVGGVVLAVAFAAAGWRALAPSWKDEQQRFRNVARLPSERPLGMVQLEACTGEVDRCTTCHLGVERADLHSAPKPLRSHPNGLRHHPPEQMGCTVCHGGTGRALDPAVAHAAPGTGTLDPRMKPPHLYASCGRCHIPGEKAGTEWLATGAKRYLELGCGVCHPLSGEGLGGWDYGPDLRESRLGLDALRTSLLDPAANFPGSTMPSFAASFADDPDGLDAMLVYLESLQLGDSGQCRHTRQRDAWASESCTRCHAGPGGKATGTTSHRCLYLKDRREELTCGRCHETVPDGTGECPVIAEHRGSCAACHGDSARKGPR